MFKLIEYIYNHINKLLIYCSDTVHTAFHKKIKNFQSVKLLPGFRCQLIDIIQFSENSIYLLNVCPMIRTYRNALYNSVFK